ncbi:MAG: two-component system, chemotaxis family, sensor kinase CheA [Methanohalophilus sp. T328-1]|nr:MAG: two-component system, chemotaxis family, sensor kinase CheA [Methanohalophilus sp. T328-1]
MDIDMDVYKDEFLQEINEYLEIFNQAFIDLENGDENALDEIFRVAHTIKGMAGFLGYTSLEKLCHKMEEVLSGIKCAEINIDSGLIDVMLETVDRINEMVEKIESQGTDDTEIQDLLESFEEYKQQGRSSTEDCAREEVSTDETVEESLDAVSSSASEDVEIIPEEEGKPKVSEGMQNDVDPLGEDCNIILDTKISNDADIKELKAVLVIESLKEEVEVIRTEPAEEEIDNTFKGKLKVFINGEAEKVQEVMEKISEIEMFEITEKGSEETKKDVAEPQLENVSEEYLASDEYNIILNTQISPSADIKELKAVLVIESMGEAGEVVRTEPAEEEIDGTFNGSLKVFIKGEADRVKDAMDRISEIESYEVIKCGPDVEYTSTDNETIKNESENYIQEKPTPQITKVSENSKETTHGYETDYKIIYESGPNNISLMSKIRDIIRNEKYSLQEKVKQLMAVFISNTQSSTDLAWEKRQYEKPRLMQPTPSEFNEDKSRKKKR